MKSVIIIGGGASGYFAAANIIGENLKVRIIEKSSKVLSKVRISGGGRCNVTHACFDNSVLVENYPRGNKELKSIFSRFNVNDTIGWFEGRGVQLKVEEDGRMFPKSNDSFSIVNCLINEAEKNLVTLTTNTEVRDIVEKVQGYDVCLRSGEVLFANYIIVAAGGSPKLTGYEFLKTLGIRVNQPVPSLFTFNLPGNTITQLMGLSVPHAKVKVTGTKLKEEGPLLITHWGLSGPVILRLSAWGAKQLNNSNYEFTIAVSWAGIDRDELENEIHLLSLNKKQGVYSHPLKGIPQRLWKYLIQKAGLPEDIQWANVSKKYMWALIDVLDNDTYSIKGKTTFKEEFVTCGGVDLREVDLTTMQSRKYPGLYFTGEVLDVDGITGGFNFQHSWASAYIAAQAIMQKANT